MTKTETDLVSAWDPAWIRRRITGIDLVVDAVGSVGFTAQMSRLCGEAASIYRVG